MSLYSMNTFTVHANAARGVVIVTVVAGGIEDAIRVALEAVTVDPELVAKLGGRPLPPWDVVQVTRGARAWLRGASATK
jgi:hypothetical protein